MSDDGRFGVTVIAFVGCVFSPAYARARRRGVAVAAEEYCAFNVVVYTPGRTLWAMTEYDAAHLQRDTTGVQLAGNRMAWDDGRLQIDFDDAQAPFGGRLVGRLQLWPDGAFTTPIALDTAGQHCWWPVAPSARFALELDAPPLHFAGTGYHDANWGAAPIESAFSYWTWSRAQLEEGAAVLYDVDRREGGALHLGRLFRHDGNVHELSAPSEQRLATSRWGIARRSRADAGQQIVLRRTYEDTPFYARSLLDTHLAGQRCVAMHEALSLDRFSKGWVRFLLPFRMRRVRGDAA